MKKILLFLALLAVLFIAFLIYFVYQSTIMMQQEEITIPPIEEITSIEDIVTPYIANDKTKALSIGIFKNGQTTYFNFGSSSNKQPSPPTNTSIYEIGSITKTFTTAVLAQMVQEGKVNLADPISKFLPAGIINWSTDTINITLEELATHQSGMPRLPDNIMKRMVFSMDNPYKSYSMADLYGFLKNYTPIPKAERKVEYSNLGMGLLGTILAAVDGRTYEQMIQKRILQPLGMTNSFIDRTGKTMITGHRGDGQPTAYWDLPTLAGAGAINANCEDLMKYLVANISNQFPFSETHTLRAKQSENTDIGLAWLTTQSKEGDWKVTFHDGGTGGFSSFIGFSKETQLGVLVLSNSVQNVAPISFRLLQFLKKQDGLAAINN